MEDTTRVCVTGGSGYIGSWIVKRLLERGYTVHATVRNSGDESKVGFLKGFPNAQRGLVLFEADLYNPLEFEKAIRGCRYVFHVATPLRHDPNSSKLIVWPLFAEQRMNALMLTQDVKVALMPRVNAESGLVGRDEVARAVKGLMEGEEGSWVRNHMMELKDAAAKVLGDDGSSTMALSKLALKWKAKLVNQLH